MSRRRKAKGDGKMTGKRKEKKDRLKRLAADQV